MAISWDQVHACLRRQFVDPRGKAEAVDIITRLCGVQAQVASSAELSVRLRQANPEAGAVERGLADGRLVKTWAMRHPASAACLRGRRFPLPDRVGAELGEAWSPTWPAPAGGTA